MGVKMKVTCISCHKKFDNDKYYGICPKCGAFNRLHLGLDDDHQRFHEMYDNGDVHSEHGKHGQYHEQYDNTTSHAKVSTSGMQGSSMYEEEKKNKKVVSDPPREDPISKAINYAKWILIVVVVVRMLMIIISTFIAILS